MVVLGFEELEYTVVEGDETVEVCVAVLEPDEIDLFISAMVMAVDGTAEGMDGYATLSVVVFFGRGGEVIKGGNYICPNERDL